MDIVKRLRMDETAYDADDVDLHHEAADEIERLRQQNAELVKALQPFAALGEMLLPADERDNSVFVTMPDDTPIRNVTLSNFTAGDFRKAAKATGGE